MIRIVKRLGIASAVALATVFAVLPETAAHAANQGCYWIIVGWVEYYYPIFAQVCVYTHF